MYCRKCGTPNDDNAYRCVQCGSVVQDPAVAALAEGPVPNYLVHSILATVFCCWPVGIPGIVFAAQVNTKLQAGDRAGALESSRKAKMWTSIAFGLGLIVILLYFVVGIFAGLDSTL